MESSNASSIGKLTVIFLVLFIVAILLAYNASAVSVTETVFYLGHDGANISGGNETNWVSYAPDAEYTGVDVNQSGIINTSFFYDNTDDYTITPYYSAYNVGADDFTVCAWINANGADEGRIITNRDSNVIGTSDKFFMLTEKSTGKIKFQISTINCAANGCDQNVETATAISYSTWHYVCGVKEGDYLRLYIDGILNVSEDDSVNSCVMQCAGDENRLLTGTGYYDSDYVNEFHGYIDEISFFNDSLSADNIVALYNSGSGCNPFTDPTNCGLAIPEPTNIEFTVRDDYTNASISNFSVNVSWSNGTTSTASTTNGSVTFYNVSDSNIIINATYLNATDYFNLTLYDLNITANTSNTIESRLFQAIATLNAFEKITNNSLSNVTFYIGNKSGITFNLSAGTYSVIAEKAGYYNLTQTINVSALSNSSYSIGGMFNTLVNFTAYNAITNATVNSFSIDLSFESSSTTNGSLSIGVINNTNYTYNISSPGLFASRYNLNFTPNTSSFNVNTSLYLFNSVHINILNESSMSALTQLVTVHSISNLTAFSNTTSTGSIILSLLQPNNYEIRFKSAGFNPRSLFITVTNDSTQNITIYMTENKSTELQQIEVLNTANQPVEGALVWLQKQKINGSDIWITIQEAQTNYNGKTSVFVERDVTIFYRFAVIYGGEARPIQPTGQLFTGPTSFIPGIDETIQLIITIEEDPRDFISDDLAVSVDCNMSNTTAVCTIIDGRNSITGAELRLEASYINKSLSWESIMNDSFTGSSGSLQVNLTALNNSIWRARAYIIYEDSESLVWEDEYRFDIDVIIEKNTGLLYSVIILAVVAALTVMWGPLPSGIVTVCALIPLTAIKIISIPTGVITGLLAIVIIFFFRTRKND